LSYTGTTSSTGTFSISPRRFPSDATERERCGSSHGVVGGAISCRPPPASGLLSVHCSHGKRRPNSPKCSVRLERAELRAPVPIRCSGTSRRNIGRRVRRG